MRVELGDLSENGDYHAAKEEQGKMQGRIHHLANLIENAVIVDAANATEVQPGLEAAEAARYLAVPTTTFTSWAKGYVRRSPDRRPVTGAPVLTTVAGSLGLSVPFISLAEDMVLAAIRQTGVPMQRIRPAPYARSRAAVWAHQFSVAAVTVVLRSPLTPT